MQTRAAILWEPHTDWSVEDIELDPPKKGEVLVKLAASGLCHSDEHMVTGDMALPTDIAEMMGISQYPIIGGHEGAGVIEEVGPGVTDLAPGDHVVFGFIPACGKWIAALPSAMWTALSFWWLVVDSSSGTRMLGTPAAASSATVIAPARQITMSASA